MFERLLSWFGTRLAAYLTRPSGRAPAAPPLDLGQLAAALRPCDVLLVEGDRRVSTAIKYLTQSTWSHAALYAGDGLGPPVDGGDPPCLIEADIVEGVRAVPLSVCAGLNVRICRPVGLSAQDRERVIDYCVGRLGDRYDLRNVFDLARYLLPTPPVPSRWRRRLLAMGSGDPTRAICSTLIAQAFQSVRYPILPIVTQVRSGDPDCDDCMRDILHIRHYRLFAPRDFDVSPYFEIVKPELDGTFDYRSLVWDDAAGTEPADPGATATVLTGSQATR